MNVRSVTLTAALLATGALAGEKAPPPERLSLEAAEPLVRDHVFRVKPTMNPAARFPLTELTTAEAWRRLGLQVFQVTQGVQACETYVIERKRVQRIGVGLGGWGVMSLVVTDLDRDGSDELLYSYSWGSGRHRSRVAALVRHHGGWHQVLARTASRDDMMLRKGKGQAVDVYLSRFPAMRSRPKEWAHIGSATLRRMTAAERQKLEAGGKPGGPPVVLAVELRDDLPDWVGKGVLR